MFCKQSGFWSLHLVLACLLRCTNDWYIDGVNIRLPFLLILTKAFDTVDHKLLSEKLNLYGLEGKELNWYKSYLKNMRQCCKVNEKDSKTKVEN